MTRLALVGATATFVIGVSTGLAAADPPLVAKAKQAGFPAKNCQYCHTSAMPKKDTFKPDDLNARGKFLVAEKEKHKAKAVDVKWLKTYPGGKEQK